MEFIEKYLRQVSEIALLINKSEIEKLIDIIASVKSEKGRLFFLGVGGSAANCSHAVNDFRKLVNIESYTPVDNVSELTARTNDEGWDTVFKEWLVLSKINEKDAIIVFSVGGGNRIKNVSTNIINALDYGKLKGAKTGCIVGKKDGYAAKNCDASIFIPDLYKFS